MVYQSSLRDGEFGPEGIFLIRLDGSEDHEIATDLPGEHVHPAWSHDGRHILFAADIGDVRQLAVVGSPGSGARLIGHCAGDCLGDDDPSFAPDDRTLAYTEASAPFIPVGGDDFPSRIELRVGTLGADGVQRARTIYRAAPRVALDEPRWSPDGSRLLFWQERYAADGENTGTAIFTIRPDGRGLRQITPWSRFAGEADWSPDGRSIVFVTHPLIVFNFDQVVSNLFTVGPDGARTSCADALHHPGRSGHPGQMDARGLDHLHPGRQHRPDPRDGRPRRSAPDADPAGRPADPHPRRRPPRLAPQPDPPLRTARMTKESS